MTTAETVLASDDQPLVATQRRVWPRVLAGFVFGFLVCLGVAGGALLAWDAGYEGRILPGVEVGGVNLAGLDRDGAAAALGAAFADDADGRIVVQTTAGDVVVPYAAFARRPDTDAMVAAAMAAGRAGSPWERALGQVRLATQGTSLAPRVTLDAGALRTAIATAVRRFDRLPIDSQVRFEQGVVVRTLARAGRAFDGAVAAAWALAAVSKVDGSDEVVDDAPER